MPRCAWAGVAWRARGPVHLSAPLHEFAGASTRAPGSGLENGGRRLPRDSRVGMAMNEVPTVLFAAIDGGDSGGEFRLFLTPCDLHLHSLDLHRVCQLVGRRLGNFLERGG